MEGEHGREERGRNRRMKRRKRGPPEHASVWASLPPDEKFDSASQVGPSPQVLSLLSAPPFSQLSPKSSLHLCTHLLSSNPFP